MDGWPHVIGYWLISASMAAIAACLTSSGAASRADDLGSRLGQDRGRLRAPQWRQVSMPGTASPGNTLGSLDRGLTVLELIVRRGEGRRGGLARGAGARREGRVRVPG